METDSAQNMTPCRRYRRTLLFVHRMSRTAQELKHRTIKQSTISHDLDSILTAILDDGTAPTELRDADVSFETPDKNFTPGQPTVNLFLYHPERFKGFWEFAQEIWHESVSGKDQCLKDYKLSSGGTNG